MRRCFVEGQLPFDYPDSNLYAVRQADQPEGAPPQAVRVFQPDATPLSRDLLNKLYSIVNPHVVRCLDDNFDMEGDFYHSGCSDLASTFAD